MKKSSILTLIMLFTIILILILSAYAYGKTHFKNDIKDFNGEINATTYEEVKNYLNEKDSKMIIIGQTGCHYCELYKPVLKEVSDEYKFKYMYINIKLFNDDDRTDFFNSDIKIPAKCTGGDKDISLKDGFGTPLTLFIKDNKTYDCIRGYKDKDNLIKELKSTKFI